MGKFINFKWGNHLYVFFQYTYDWTFFKKAWQIECKFVWDFLEPSRQLTVHWQPIMLQLHRESDLHPRQSHICLLGGQQNIHWWVQNLTCLPGLLKEPGKIISRLIFPEVQRQLKFPTGIRSIQSMNRRKSADPSGNGCLLIINNTNRQQYGSLRYYWKDTSFFYLYSA